MKKLLILLLIPLFAACSSDDKEGESTLVDSTFATYLYEGGGSVGVPTYNVYLVYKFITINTVEITLRRDNAQGSIIGNTINGSYNLKYPIINIKIGDDIETNGTFKDKNTFIVETNLGVEEYTKQ